MDISLTGPVMFLCFCFSGIIVLLVLLAFALYESGILKPVPEIEPPLETFHKFQTTKVGQATEAASRTSAQARRQTPAGQWLLRLEQGSHRHRQPQSLDIQQIYALVSDRSLLFADEEPVLLNLPHKKRFARLEYGSQAQPYWIIKPDRGQSILVNGKRVPNTGYACQQNPSKIVVAGHQFELTRT